MSSNSYTKSIGIASHITVFSTSFSAGGAGLSASTDANGNGIAGGGEAKLRSLLGGGAGDEDEE